MTTSSAFSPAGFWKRYVAYFIDLVLVYIVLEVLSTVFFSAIATSEFDQAKQLLTAALTRQTLPQEPGALLAQTQPLLWTMLIFSSGVYIVIGTVYFALCESSSIQATLGKRMIGIKVTDTQGKRISLTRALVRFFAASLSWLTFNLGHALAAWTPERRALHDYIAGTRVENSDPSQTKMPLWGTAIIAAHALFFILFTLGMAMLMAYTLSSLSSL